MKIIKETRKEFLLAPSKSEESYRGFVFDFGFIPLKPTPRRIAFKSNLNRDKWWVMSWNRFGKETVFIDKKHKDNDVCLVRKEHMHLIDAPS